MPKGGSGGIVLEKPPQTMRGGYKNHSNILLISAVCVSIVPIFEFNETSF